MTVFRNVTDPPLSEQLPRGSNTTAMIKMLFAPRHNEAFNAAAVARITGYSQTTVKRAMEDTVDIVTLQQSYPRNVQRTRSHEERDERLSDFLDEYCPYQSGTNHRRLVGTFEHLYEQYKQHEIDEGHTVSPSKVIFS